MTDQKPTGVFVRLPLSEERAQAMYDYVAGDISKEDAILAIGTPVTGGELAVVDYSEYEPVYHDQGMGCGLEDRGIHDRYEAMSYGWEQAMERACSEFPETTLLSDAQAQIAARDAEIARLNEELSVYRAGMHELIAKEVATLKAEIRERNEKIEQDNAALAKLSEQLEDAGAQKVINLLAKLVGVNQWEAGDGTEEWDGDVQLTLQNILEEAGIFHKDKGFSTHPEAEANSLPFPQKMTPDIEGALGLVCFRIIPYVNAFRAGGEDIKSHAEEEQAAIIFKVLRKVLAGMAFEVAFQEMHKEAYEAQEKAKKGGA
ncbi:MAG: hypothetical protein ABF751_09800 [Acetobacter orientalis]|uniref:hypothetical protein n=1 Tax=Acetobacter TaxID=434 RepID=UPI0039EA680C